MEIVIIVIDKKDLLKIVNFLNKYDSDCTLYDTNLMYELWNKHYEPKGAFCLVYELKDKFIQWESLNKAISFYKTRHYIKVLYVVFDSLSIKFTEDLLES